MGARVRWRSIGPSGWDEHPDAFWSVSSLPEPTIEEFELWLARELVLHPRRCLRHIASFLSHASGEVGFLGSGMRLEMTCLGVEDLGGSQEPSVG